MTAPRPGVARTTHQPEPRGQMLERHYRFGLTSSQSGTQHRLAGLATEGKRRALAIVTATGVSLSV